MALFNAATYREVLGDYKATLSARERYLQLWPKAKDAEQVFLSIADLYEKMGLFNKAMAHLEEYERQNIRSPSKVLMAEGRIARIFEEKLKKPKDTARLYGRILDYYEKLPKRMQKELEPAALTAVARAHYLAAEPEFAYYARLKLAWGRPPSPDKLKASIAEKSQSLEAVQKKYVQIVSFGAADSGLCALHRIGMAYDNFADRIINVPMPPGLDAESEQAIRDEFANQAMPIKEKAAEAFATTVAKSQELDVFNACSAESLKLLRTAYRPDQFPEVPEDTVALARGKDPALGGDVLAAIQEVPPPVAQAATTEQSQTAENLKEDLGDLTRQLREQTATQVDKPQATPDKANPKGKPVEDQEPEDFL